MSYNTNPRLKGLHALCFQPVLDEKWHELRELRRGPIAARLEFGRARRVPADRVSSRTERLDRRRHGQQRHRDWQQVLCAFPSN